MLPHTHTRADCDELDKTMTGTHRPFAPHGLSLAPRRATKHLLVCCACLLGTTALFPEERVRSDGFRELESEIRKVTDVQPVERSPLFDNLPFLRLRPNDKVVRARAWSENGKGMEPGFYERWDNFFCSHGVYYHIWANEDDGHNKLWSAASCLLFDWDVTMENATRWKEIGQRGVELTKQDYIKIIKALGDKMPELVRRLEGDSTIKEAKLVTLPSGSYVAFEGIIYQEELDQICKYVLKVGPAVYYETSEILVAGPATARRMDFEGYRGTSDWPNSMPPFEVSPDVAIKKKAEYERMMLFRQVVRKALGLEPPVRE